MQRISEIEKQYALEALSNQFRMSTNGKFNTRMEQKFGETFRAKFSIGHVNGTATMHTALVALGVKAGDEVIVPPLTMSSTALAALHCGAIPVFADVDPETFTLDPKSVRKVITDKTKAMIPVSIYGLSPDYDELRKICTEFKLGMVEDNAECFLGEYKGKLVGEFGEFASFSFQASKHMTCGAGGMLTTNNQDLADRARRFSSLGYASVSAKAGTITKKDVQDPNYSRHVAYGFNYRMSEVQAAVALGQIERLRELVDVRVRSARIFEKAVRTTDLLKPQAEPSGYKNSFWAYAVQLQTDRPETDWYRFRDLFQANGGDGYYAAWKLGYMEPFFQNEVQNYPGVWQKYQKGLCPVSERLQARMIQFKTNYWDLDRAEKQAEILQTTLQQYKR